MCKLLLFPIILSLLNSLVFQEKLSIFCVHGWRKMYTNLYTYHILANYTTYTYTTYKCTTLRYDTKTNEFMKYRTTYNARLMLLRTILILQYNYLQINIIND